MGNTKIRIMIGMIFVVTSLFVFTKPTFAACPHDDSCDQIVEVCADSRIPEDYVETCRTQLTDGCHSICQNSEDAASCTSAACPEACAAIEIPGALGALATPFAREQCSSRCSQICGALWSGGGTTPPGGTSPTGGGSSSNGSYGLIDPLGSKSIPTILGGITRVALGFVGSLFLLFFIWGGALWMTAGGEGEKVKTAQKAIRNAVLGMLVVMFAYVLINALIGISSSVQSRAPAATNRTTPP